MQDLPLETVLQNLVGNINSNDFDEALYVKNLRTTVLPQIANDYLKIDHGNIADLKQILSLLDLISTQFPQVFWDGDHTPTLAALILKLIPFFGVPKYSDLYKTFYNSLSSLTTLLCGQDIRVFRFFFKDVTILLGDLVELLSIYSSKQEYGMEVDTLSSFFNLVEYYGAFSSDSYDSFSLFSPLILDVSTVESIVSLQGCITSFIGKMIARHHDILEDLCGPQLWQLFSVQLHLADAKLKQITLKSFFTLVSTMDIPLTAIDCIARSLVSILQIDFNLEYLRNKSVDDALGNFIHIFISTIPPKKINDVCQNICMYLPTQLSKTSSDILRVSLLECFEYHLQNHSIPTVDILLPYIGISSLQKYIVSCFNLEIKKQSVDNSIEVTKHTNKRRKLDFNSSPDLAGTEINLLFDTLGSIENEFQCLPKSQELLSSVISFETVVRICFQHSEKCPISLLLNKFSSCFDAVLKVFSDEEINLDSLKCYEVITCLLSELLKQESFTYFSTIINKTTFGSLALKYLQFPFQNTELFNTDINNEKNENYILVISIFQKCLELLSWLPNDFSVEKRLQFFHSSLNNKNTEIRASAISSLPTLMYRVGRKYIEKFSTELNNLNFNNQEYSKDIKNLSKNIGLIVCVESSNNSCSLKFKKEETLNNNNNNNSEFSDKIKLKKKRKINEKIVDCSFCDKKFHEKPFFLKENRFQIWNNFSIIISNKNLPSKIRSFFIFSYARILNHTPISKEKKSELIINYLNLSIDKDIKVRESLILSLDILKHNFETQEVDILFEKLTKLSKKSSESNIPIQETILQVLGKIGCYVKNDSLYVVLLSMIQYLVNQNVILKSIAYEQICLIAYSKKITQKELLMIFKDKIYLLFLEEMFSSSENSSENIISNPSYVEEVCNTLLNLSLDKFLEISVPETLPILIFQGKINICKDIAKTVSKENGGLARLCVENIDKILAYTLLQVDEWNSPRFKTVMAALISITNHGVQDLVDSCVSGVLNMIFVYLGDPKMKDHIIHNFHMIIRAVHLNDKLFQMTPEVVPDFLAQHFLGMMDEISRIFLGNESKLISKTLRALDSLLELIEHNINSLWPKTMVTLTLLAQKLEFAEETCDVWFTFIKRLEKEKCLGRILSQIFANLTPYMSIVPQKIGVIFSFLFLEKRKELSKFFKDIPCLPQEIPEFREINKVLEKEKNLNLNERVEQLISGISHDSADVRIMILDQLQVVFQLYNEEIHKKILGDVDDPLINKIISSLLVAWKETNSRARIRYGKCLGELGAIDIGRLDVQLKTKRKEKYDDQSVAIHLISECLVKALSASTNTTSQDRAAFAIQQLLRDVLGVTMDLAGKILPPKLLVKQKKAVSHWQTFPEETRAIILPYLTSSYRLDQKKSVNSEIDIEPVNYKPFYNSNSSYQKWISSWTNDLILRSKGSKKPIFEACKGVIKNDLATAHYLLPYLILSVIGENGNKEDKLIIIKEFLTVLTNAGNEHSPGKATREVSEVHQMSTQRVFYLIDWLKRWMDLFKKNLPETPQRESRRTSTSSKTVKKAIEPKDPQYIGVKEFLSEIPQDAMANAAYRCKTYTRAFLHQETYIREQIEKENPKKKNSQTPEEILQNYSTFLQKIYVGLDEPDGLDGIATIRKATTDEELFMDLEASGQWTEALATYDRALQVESGDLNIEDKLSFGLLNCLRNLGHLEIMSSVRQARSISRKNCLELDSYGVQAAWRLCDWENLSSLLSNWNNTHTDDFEVSLGQLLLSLKTNNEKYFNDKLMLTRRDVMASLSAASMESYHRSYPLLVKLHMLTELETGFELVNTPNKVNQNAIFKDWDTRLTATQISYKLQEPIINLRKTIATLIGNDEQIGNCWLQLGKIARKSGQLQAASYAVQMSKPYDTLTYYKEKALLLQAQDQKQGATLELKKLLNYLPSNINSAPRPQQDMWAKAHLLLARWLQETGQTAHSELYESYKKITKLTPSEKALFYMAKYLDSLTNNVESLETPNRRSSTTKKENSRHNYVLYAIQSYGLSLHRGHSFIFQALPRFLTLWFSESENETAPQKGKSTSTEVVEKSKSGMPAYQWLTCFPQLVSRITHPNPHTSKLLQTILLEVFNPYPHQAWWLMVALSKSRHNTRQKRAGEVLQKARQQSKAKNNMAGVFIGTCNCLLTLCEATLPKEDHRNSTSSYSLKGDPTLSKAKLNGVKNTEILVPLQSSLTVTLPPDGITDKEWNPFDSKLPTIDGFRDKVDIMSSLQSPKKITMFDRNDTDYYFLCKPNDDLRKDSRMMEFNTLINKLLKKDPHTRKRQLHIKTYAVIPLSENSGLIEWVPNTQGFKHILTEVYKAEGHNGMAETNEVKQMLIKNPKNCLNIYEKTILPKFPPIFHKWFLEHFPEPSVWFTSRLAYTRSVAVMSMIGYVVGLGDRHGENILFSSETGEAVHVDLNCLFWKGESFSQPEKVPFRLTRNIQDAMGLTKHEGVFRKVCEQTLGLLRSNKETLLSVLETFIYDPFVDFVKSDSKGNDKQPAKKAADKSAGKNYSALKIVEKIEKILDGIQDLGLPLSVEGQVSAQIQAATLHTNLASMYGGWTAWL